MRRRTLASTTPMSHASGPNDAWSLDFKGLFRQVRSDSGSSIALMTRRAISGFYMFGDYLSRLQRLRPGASFGPEPRLRGRHREGALNDDCNKTHKRECLRDMVIEVCG